MTDEEPSIETFVQDGDEQTDNQFAVGFVMRHCSVIEYFPGELVTGALLTPAQARKVGLALIANADEADTCNGVEPGLRL